MKLAILITFVSFCLISCNYTPPRLTPDVLEVNQIVRINPVGTMKWNADEGGHIITMPNESNGKSYFIVNKEFMAWVFELKEEIKRLRN